MEKIKDVTVGQLLKEKIIQNSTRVLVSPKILQKKSLIKRLRLALVEAKDLIKIEGK